MGDLTETVVNLLLRVAHGVIHPTFMLAWLPCNWRIESF